VLHARKRRRRAALDARAGDAYHVVLALVPTGVAGAAQRLYTIREAKRSGGAGERAADRGQRAADVRRARPRGFRQRGSDSGEGFLRAESLSLRQLSRRHRSERASIPPVRSTARAGAPASAKLSMRRRLPELRRAGWGSRGAREGSGAPVPGGVGI